MIRLVMFCRICFWVGMVCFLLGWLESCLDDVQINLTRHETTPPRRSRGGVLVWFGREVSRGRPAAIAMRDRQSPSHGPAVEIVVIPLPAEAIALHELECGLGIVVNAENGGHFAVVIVIVGVKRQASRPGL